MDPQRVTPPRRFDSSVWLAVLVGLPLVVLVASVLVSTLGLKDDRKPQAATESPKNEVGEPAAEASVDREDVAATSASEKTSLSNDGDQENRSERSENVRQAGNGNALKSDSPSAAGEKASVAKPWQAVVELAGEPPSYRQVAFQSFEEAFDHPGRDDLNPWFERTSSAGFRINKIPTQYGKSGTIEGIGRLLSPWPADGVLRLQLENFNRLKMHFFCGLEGITLIYYEDQGNRWAAYATTRDKGKPTPKSWAITATDDDRCRRTELRFGGSIELRCRNGELLLSRGDVVLLTAPLAGPPDEVFVEGRATIHGIALARTKDAPSALESNAAKAELSPGKLTWETTKPEIAKPELMGGGAVRLARVNGAQRAECYAFLPTKDIHEVILELADVTPGAGVYLGREGGKLAEVIRFCRDRRSGGLAAALRRENDGAEGDFDSPGDKAAPLVNPHCWVKLLYGCGNVRWWLSADGVHWAQTEPALDGAPPGVTSIGLQLAENMSEAQLTVKRIILQPLDGLSSLGKNDLVDRAPTDVTSGALDAWLPKMMKQKPADIATIDWLRACSVRTLAGGAARELAYPLLEALLDDAATRGFSLEEQLVALDDAGLLALDLRDGHAMRVGLVSRYVQLGLRAADERGLPAWSSIRNHYFAIPVMTWMQTPPDLDRIIRWELIVDAYQHTPQRTLEFLQRLRFFHQHRDRHLVDWVEMLARREVTDRSGGDFLAKGKDSWRELLVEEISKDTYNLLTELKAVLQSDAWDDAARLVASIDPRSTAGVAPYLNDRTLLASLPVAMQLALEDYPQLRQSLGDKFEGLAKLRIAQAINAGDAATIELATVQFAGTPAAADAHRWLGDHALVAGQFSRAISSYQRALAAAPAAEVEIAPRIRLAAAMLGRDLGSAVTKSVQFGEVTMSPAEFEALVAEMRSRSPTSSDPLESRRSPPAVPPPSEFQSQVRSRLDGPVGERPQEEIGRRTNQLRISWPDRQIATARDGDLMYVANHFQVAAYRLATGERVWQSQAPPGTMQRAQEWTLIPMRPLVAGDRIFVRLLYSPGPILACLDKSSGKLLWTAENREREFLVSDPLLMEGQLVVLGITVQPDQNGLLRHYTFDPQTGEMLRQHDLAQLRSTWPTRACCEVVEVDDGLVAALGGLTMGIGSAGNVRWIRTHVTLPADEDPRSPLQLYQRPLAVGDRVYVAQPGVRTIECLSAATGRQHWSAVLPEVTGIVGITGELLIVRTEADMRALATSDGTVRWRYATDHLFDFPLLDNGRLLVAHRERAPGQSDRWQPWLTWIDPATGTPLGTTALPDLADSDPRLGPLVPYKSHLFCFFGRGQHDPTREIVELIPQAGASHASAPADAWHQRLER